MDVRLTKFGSKYKARAHTLDDAIYKFQSELFADSDAKLNTVDDRKKFL